VSWTKKPAADDTPVDGIPIIDASEVEPYVDAEPGDDFESEIPTLVEPVTAVGIRAICRTCPGEFMVFDDAVGPPTSHGQAWSPPEGSVISGMCRGNKKWRWCRAAVEHKHTGTLTVLLVSPDGVETVHHLFFPDKRVAVRHVAVERRGLPKGKP
jgi:hypothetical protein